ncbi:GyrI-like domain-containing protein [Bacteroides sp. 519]|uniref:AraC family transcriptional regulator n=1 Tax=Bacteroides sp. 519 TaxID=2302937 RepID=UPI0013D7B3A0|nr:AraC family transcriptional regulator [Bacteroides sp. 519]MDL2224238.1 AraC family transcriptional regulator [Bacteroidales bacterium OttesenSCG-928-M06]NDV56858.1 AraC family transcriptional regulator [Bacteroides sp. 519]
MNIQENSRIEYQARINRVMDYIDQHLDQSLELKAIADIANFSPFHFHRIFSFLIGETPIDYIQRLRVEKAAWKLRESTPDTITEIAYGCGFGSVSLFSRTFKKHFGMTPSQFSKADKPVYSQNGKLFSKNGQILRKNLKSDAGNNTDLCIVESNQFYFMKANIEVKEMPEMKAVYVRHIGAFNQIGQAYEKLFKWAYPRGLYTPNVSKSASITHDDPSVTELDKIRQSACIIIEEDVKVDGEIGKLTIPGGKYAVGHFELGFADFEKAWNSMCNWFVESGYQQGDGCTYELYHNDYTTHPEQKHIVDICIPVKPL